MTTRGVPPALGARLDLRTRTLPPARQVRFGLVLDRLRRCHGDAPLRVLDAGAGDAMLAERLARWRPSWEIVAVDVDAKMLAAARRRLSRAPLPNLAVRRLDLTAEPIAPATFDIALAIECLVEIRDDDAALRAIARALRPGGLFVTHVPLDDWTPVMRGSPRTWRYEVRHGYQPDVLRDKLARAGLRVTEMRRTGQNAVFAGQELADRIKSSRVRVRAAALPLTAGAAMLERAGVTWGPHRALLVSARRA